MMRDQRSVRNRIQRGAMKGVSDIASARYNERYDSIRSLQQYALRSADSASRPTTKHRTRRAYASTLASNNPSLFPMSIQVWLGETPKQQFVAEYFHKLPFSRAGGGREFRHLGDWQALDEVLRGEGADVMLAERGRRRWDALPRSAEAAQSLVAGGCTVLVRHAERHHAGIARLAESFAADFAAPVNVHVYVTPPGEFGFGWHYDAEDVFILQAAGGKEYSLRKNTVNPWPLEETLPDDMRYEREIMPLMRCGLSAGDWLYIPAGYWHKAEGVGEKPSISLAVGVMSPAAITIYDRLRRRLLDSLLWRQRLPITGAASPLSKEELRARYRELLAQLSGDLVRLLELDDFVDELVEHTSPKR